MLSLCLALVLLCAGAVAVPLQRAEAAAGSWQEVGHSKATSILNQIRQRTYSQNVVVIYYRSTCSYSKTYVPQFKSYAKENGLTVYAYDDNSSSVLDAFWNMPGIYGTVVFPCVVVYNSTSKTILAAHSVHSLTSFANLAKRAKLFDKPIGGFLDIKSGSYCEDAVIWATGRNIHSGTGTGYFYPDNSCTRYAALDMLWKAAGSPEPQTIPAEPPYTDIVDDVNYYYDQADDWADYVENVKPILWATEQGITNGTGNGRFEPYGSCSRAQMATMLWRYAGSPEGEAADFADVDSGAYYAQAVAWAAQRRITNGTGGGCFSPDTVCSRADYITFLYRYAH